MCGYIERTPLREGPPKSRRGVRTPAAGQRAWRRPPLNRVDEVDPALVPALGINEGKKITLRFTQPEDVSTGRYEVRVRSSSLTQHSSSSFLLMLVLWIFAVLIIPRTAVLVSGRAAEVPSVDRINYEKNKYMSQLWRDDREKMNAYFQQNPPSPKTWHPGGPIFGPT